MTFPYLAQDAIVETYRHLLSGQRDTINLLAQDLDGTTGTITLSDTLEGVQPGSLLGVDLEVLYVRTTNPTSKTATVIRQWLGSTGGTHNAGTPVYVNPRFSAWDIFSQLNTELADLSSPDSGLFAVGEVEVIFQPSRRGYEIPVPRDEIDGILEIRYKVTDATLAWPRLRGYEPMWDTNISDFPSGTAIRLDGPSWPSPGMPMRVKYSRPFVPMTALDDDLVADCLLPKTAVDIPALGAAAMLMFHKEAKRSFLESQGDTRRAAEVPPGSSTRDAATLLGLRNRRVSAEASRITANYPNYIAR